MAAAARQCSKALLFQSWPSLAQQQQNCLPMMPNFKSCLGYIAEQGRGSSLRELQSFARAFSLQPLRPVVQHSVFRGYSSTAPSQKSILVRSLPPLHVIYT